MTLVSVSKNPGTSGLGTAHVHTISWSWDRPDDQHRNFTRTSEILKNILDHHIPAGK